jgi:hypothetical protein
MKEFFTKLGDWLNGIVNPVLTPLFSWLNRGANALGEWLLAPIAAMPGWQSATLVGAVTGVLLVFVYKYTSPQRAVKRVRDDISANLLALKLFKDSMAVSLKSQGRLLRGAAMQLLLGVVPMLVMLVPVSLLYYQLHLWYHTRPLRVGDEASVTMIVRADPEAARHDVSLEPSGAVEDKLGPLLGDRSKRELCWKIEARQDGYHRLVFQVNGQRIEKELAIGDGYMRVNTLRPGWSWYEVLENPGEQPFAPESPVQSIKVQYEDEERGLKIAWLPWMIYWFIVSLIAGYFGSKIFNVNI